VARTLREDPVNPDVLFLGTELGLFWSNDRGRTWAELRGGMPLMAFNDLFIHPREHDLVLGTHSRGIWILDNVRALRELTPQCGARLHVFSTRPPSRSATAARSGTWATCSTPGRTRRGRARGLLVA
jgi:hypothetical protein